MILPNREFITGLIAEIKSVTGLDRVYTIPPKKTVYPYIYLSEDNYEEIGPKNSFIFEGDILCEINAKNVTDIEPILTKLEEIAEFVNNDTPFFLGDNFVIRRLGLNRVDTETPTYSEDGRIETASIRMEYRIERPNTYDPNTYLQQKFIDSLTYIYANDNVVTT